MIDGLTPNDSQWRAMEKHILARLDTLRDALEAPQDAEATATLRGQVIALRALLREATTRPGLDTEKRVSGAPHYQR